MKILQPNTASTINFKVIPRLEPVNVVAIIRNEFTKKSINYNVTPTYSNGFMTLSDVFLVDEGMFYQLTIKYDLFRDRVLTDNGSFEGSACYDVIADTIDLDVIYRGRIFCTAQTDFDKYTVASGVYKEVAADNDTYKT